MDTILTYNKHNIFGKDNKAPQDIKALKKALHIKTCAIYEHHACVNECEAFDYLPKSEWKNHTEDCCSVCKTRRFETIKTGGVDVPVPRRKFYVFGILNAIKRYDQPALFIVMMMMMDGWPRKARGGPPKSGPLAKPLDCDASQCVLMYSITFDDDVVCIGGKLGRNLPAGRAPHGTPPSMGYGGPSRAKGMVPTQQPS